MLLMLQNKTAIVRELCHDCLQGTLEVVHFSLQQLT